jgi:hypothetical protein
MICAAKNDEKEMFARLVQNATVVKNLPNNFIISIIDEENNSLLHYLVVWGYDADIQLLEAESTWKTTLKNKQNLTPVHFAAYLGRHKFLELFLKLHYMFREVILSIAVALLIGDYQFCASKTPVASTAIS